MGIRLMSISYTCLHEFLLSDLYWEAEPGAHCLLYLYKYFGKHEKMIKYNVGLTKKPSHEVAPTTSATCDREIWPMTLTFELHL